MHLRSWALTASGDIGALQLPYKPRTCLCPAAVQHLSSSSQAADKQGGGPVRLQHRCSLAQQQSWTSTVLSTWAVRRPSVDSQVEVEVEQHAAQVAEQHQHSALSGRDEYDRMYKRSVENPNAFWRELAEEYHWEQQCDEQHISSNFDVRKGRIFTKFFKGGKTNMAYNCLDRHIEAGRGEHTCFLWEGNEPGHDRKMSYKEVLVEVNKLANWLKANGVGKGDTVAIYMPMVCELPMAMLACARIGAVHSVVFAGFSSDSLAARIESAKSKVVLTASGVLRGKKKLDVKKIVDKGLSLAASNGFQVEHCLVLEKPEAMGKGDTPWTEGRDRWWDEEVAGQSSECAPEWMGAEDPLFMLFTSGSTGAPKGVLHTTGGYMVMAGMTTKYVFDMQPQDTFWCTADCGWITGHTYLTYGPLLNGATNVVFEGQPTYPSYSRCWEIIEKYKVTQFYTAPTLIRSLMQAGDHHVRGDRSSLRVLGSVGEPINPSVFDWYAKVVGQGKCSVVDTYWQTETGAHVVAPLPGVWPAKPGSATLPFFGVQPAMVNEQGKEIDGPGEGFFCIKAPWPSTLRTVYGDHARYETTYFEPFKGYYFSGDGCRRDEDGYYWITGRVDDVINVSGHRIGTAEVESALVTHPKCAEAAVVGVEHPIKGQGIYAYCTLTANTEPSDELKKELVMSVRSQIGAFAAPDVIHWAPGLPKTRSGKIMRRVLRKIAAKEEEGLGDTSTLADPSVVDQLIGSRPV